MNLWIFSPEKTTALSEIAQTTGQCRGKRFRETAGGEKVFVATVEGEKGYL